MITINQIIKSSLPPKDRAMAYVYRSANKPFVFQWSWKSNQYINNKGDYREYFSWMEPKRLFRLLDISSAYWKPVPTIEEMDMEKPIKDWPDYIMIPGEDGEDHMNDRSSNYQSNRPVICISKRAKPLTSTWIWLATVLRSDKNNIDICYYLPVKGNSSIMKKES